MQPHAHPGPAHRTRIPHPHPHPTPLFEKKGCGFENVDCITRINLIVVNMQCLQYVFHSLLSLHKDRVYVTGDSKQSPDPTNCRPSGFEIPGYDPACKCANVIIRDTA